MPGSIEKLCCDHTDAVSCVQNDCNQKASAFLPDFSEEEPAVIHQENLHFFLFPLSKTFELTRNMTEDLQVSSHHFEIRKKGQSWILEDLHSTNGTFINGIRTDHRKLMAGDWIAAGRTYLIFLTGYLLISRKVPGCSDLPCTRSIQPVDIFEAEEKEETDRIPSIEVEGFTAVQEPEPPHWFTSIGPSSMILASSLTSAIFHMVNNPKDVAGAVSGMASSLSMAGAFLLFGLINRQITLRQNRKPVQKQRQLYKAYLQEIKEQILMEKEKASASWQDHIQNAGDHLFKAPEGGTVWRLPLGKKYQAAVRLKKPVIRYDQKEDPLTGRLEEVFRIRLQVPVPDWIIQGEMIRAEVEDAGSTFVETIFELYCRCLHESTRRFVYIGQNWKPPLQHPAVVLDNVLLCFPVLHDFLQLADRYPRMEWFIVSDCLEEPGQLPDATWISTALRTGRKVKIASFAAMNLSLLRQTARPCLQKIRENIFLRLSDPEASLAWFRTDQENTRMELDTGCTLDLQHGPHMLIAGTTGSGKSEGLTHMLLQLSLHNSASRLQYILIDFKGGAFGSVFYEFPHLAGALTNLEAGNMERLHRALILEIEKRQRAFAEMMKEYPFASADLHDYNRLYPDHPISHLLIVVDEFAQLKAQCPEFLRHLQESARIGRSLGFHLILATQKPAGIIDEQIWSNCRIKMCFMVHSAADSREVLGHEKASQLSEPGEFICEIAGQNTLEGRMGYTRVPLHSQKELTVRSREGRILYQSPPSETVLARASGLILSADEKRTWILSPDLSSRRDNFWGLHMDALTHSQLWDIRPGFPVWIQGCEEHIVEAAGVLAAASELPVYSSFPLSEADYQVPVQSLWQMTEIEEGLLLLQEKQLEEQLLLYLLTSCRMSVAVFSQDVLHRKEKILNACPVRIGFSLRDKEEQYLLFGRGTDSVPQWPGAMIQEGKNIQTACFGKAHRKIPKRRTDLPEMRWIHNPLDLETWLQLSPCLLGFDIFLGNPVFYEGLKPLILAFSQPHLKEKAEILVKLWKLQLPDLEWGQFPDKARIRILELPRQAAALNTQEGIEALYESDICFIGKGLRDWQFALKLPAAAVETAGNCVLFGKETKWIQMGEIV